MTEILNIIGVVAVLWLFWACGRIVERLGYNMLWGLLIFIPGVNFLALMYIAYFRWPIERANDQSVDDRRLLWKRSKDLPGRR